MGEINAPLTKVYAHANALADDIIHIHRILTSKHFWSFHKLLGELYDEMLTDIDRVGEHIVQYNEALPHPSIIWNMIPYEPADNPVYGQQGALDELCPKIKIFLNIIEEADQLTNNIGTKSMLSDIYERWSKNVLFKLKGYDTEEIHNAGV